MADITAALVKQLRERTGAGMMECKSALVEAKGELTEAEVVLRKRGLASAGKKAGRATKQGLIGTYIHHGGQLGVLVEVNCESDFVARTDAFQELVKDLGMQVAAANPSFVAREDVPKEVVEKEREIYRGQLADQKKPPQVLDKIIEGKLEKFFTDQCLLEQPFIKDSSGKTKVRELVDGVNAKTGERIVVKRFARFQVGEGG
jgi:elongation factor Ts